jgi:hydrogenase expression/formation protein HypD
VKFLDEYRDGGLARQLAREIHRVTTRPWNVMEVCGGQTHAIVKFGIDELLPRQITLIHGPGCPVCVTALETIDQALAIAARPGVIFASFGDMCAFPAARRFAVGESGAAAMRIVYSPLDAVRLAAQNRKKSFSSVWAETTAPATAMVFSAQRG